MTVQRQMPQYQSHKIVGALKIKSVQYDSDIAVGRETDGSAVLTFEHEGFEPIKVDHAFVRKHNPQPGGYYVVYPDGYKSWSPAGAFESGYTRIE